MVSVEEKLLVNVLYKEEREALQGIDISNVNFENLIKLASMVLYFSLLTHTLFSKRKVPSANIISSIDLKLEL